MPFELFTFLGSAILGTIKSIFMMKAKQKAQLAEAQLVAMNPRAKIQKEVREHDDKGFKWTRRTIALLIAVCVMLLPMAGPYISMYSHLFGDFSFPVLPVSFGYTELTAGFWPFVEGKEVTKWVEFDNGLVITPFHTNMMAAVVGFYMGDSQK